MLSDLIRNTQKGARTFHAGKRKEKVKTYTYSSYSFSNLNSFPVESISILDCALNNFSSDHIPQFEANARAKYCMSLSCGANSLASSANLLKSSNGRVLICSLISEKSSDNSSLFNLLLFSISSKFFPTFKTFVVLIDVLNRPQIHTAVPSHRIDDMNLLNSKNINSGAMNSNFFESEFKESTLNTFPLESKHEYNLLVSTITNIFYLPKDCMNLCDKALSDFTESSFTSLSVNLDLATILFNPANLSNSGLIILVITKESFSFDNSLISSSNSLGIDTVTSVITKNNNSDYLRFSFEEVKARC